MKKNIISLSLLLLTAQCIMGATKNEILQILVSSHNGAFGKDNLYKEPIAADDLRRWESAMSEAKKFVIANGSTLRVLDVDFIKALSTVEAANKDLINFINNTRLAIQSPNTVKQNIAVFDRIKQAMIQVQKNLNHATFFTNKADKTLAKDILISMAMFIETTAAKAIKDTAKM